MTATLPAVVQAPAGAVHLACPLDVCPSPSRLIGAIWHEQADAGLSWHTVSPLRPGQGREDGPYEAALRVITAHVLDDHHARYGDRYLWLAVSHAAEAARREALGLIPTVQPTTGECFWCGGRVDVDPQGRWVDGQGDDICLASARRCDRLCAPHADGPAVTRCPECEGYGEAYGPHEPICGPWSRTA